MMVWLTDSLKLDGSPHALPCKRGAGWQLAKPRIKDLTTTRLEVLLWHQYQLHALIAQIAAG